jgi:hypothetical protein
MTVKPTITARAELAWLDGEHCRSLADSDCAMPGSFAEAYVARHYQAVPPVSHVSEPWALPLALAGVAVVMYIARRRPPVNP